MSSAQDLTFKDANHLKSSEDEDDITASQIWTLRGLRYGLCAVTNHSKVLVDGLSLL